MYSAKAHIREQRLRAALRQYFLSIEHKTLPVFETHSAWLVRDANVFVLIPAIALQMRNISQYTLWTPHPLQTTPSSPNYE